jgi:hypothetical protein
MNNKSCGRVVCRYAHVIPGTEDPNTNTYVVINKATQLRLQLNQQSRECIVSSCQAKVGGAQTIIAVSSLSNLYVVNIDEMKLMDVK